MPETVGQIAARVVIETEGAVAALDKAGIAVDILRTKISDLTKAGIEFQKSWPALAKSFTMPGFDTTGLDKAKTDVVAFEKWWLRRWF